MILHAVILKGTLVEATPPESWVNTSVMLSPGSDVVTGLIVKAWQEKQGAEAELHTHINVNDVWAERLGLA